MADVKWIKITTDIFDDEKILLIESLPSADSIITVWFKLLTLAGKQNNNGVFVMNDKIAYTDEMLATIFRRELNVVRLALNTFEQFGMIEIINGVITIPNWNKHQTLDSYEKKKIRDREYQANRRAEQKKLALKSVDESPYTSFDASSDTSSDVGVSEVDKEEDIDKEEEKEKDVLTVSKDTVCLTDVQRVLEEWNTLSVYGIKSVSRLTSGTKRHDSLVARIKQYGVESVIDAIEKVRNSDFLQGKNRNGWQITFDWFVLPNNFPKVIDGNYDNGSNAAKGSYLDRIDNRVSEVDNW